MEKIIYEGRFRLVLSAVPTQSEERHPLVGWVAVATVSDRTFVPLPVSLAEYEVGRIFDAEDNPRFVSAELAICWAERHVRPKVTAEVRRICREREC